MRHGSRLLRLTRRAGWVGLREDPSLALPARGGRTAGWCGATVRRRWNRSDRGQCPARGRRPARPASLGSFRRSGAGYCRANESERPCACDMCVNRAVAAGCIGVCACRIRQGDASRSTLNASWFTAAAIFSVSEFFEGTHVQCAQGIAQRMRRVRRMRHGNPQPLLE